jgi:hypothetical protein
MLASCDASPSQGQSPNIQNSGGSQRKISGVLTLHSEGSSFRQCALREPWNCLLNKETECGFVASPQGEQVVSAAIDKAKAYQGFATFGVVMLGSRVDGVTSGHLDAYDCEFRARTILKVYEVPSVPPAE